MKGGKWDGTLSQDQLTRASALIGVFKGDGRTDQARADTTVAARVEVTPLKGLLDVGISASQGEAHGAQPEAQPLSQPYPDAEPALGEPRQEQ